jgi:ABC-type phosphate transport system substrate-binding protein
MRMRSIKLGLAAGVTLATGLAFALPGAASADTAARSGDVVGVGSDTLQNMADFLFDGAPSNVSGYNSTVANNHRVFNFYATGDANGRAVYDGTCGTAGTSGLGTLCSATTNTAPNIAKYSVILREGTNPVTRPNGSGQGVAALIDDSPGLSPASTYDGLPNDSIQFARMSRLPSSSSDPLAACDADTTGCDGIHVYQAAIDDLAMAHVKTGYDGPSTGLSLNELATLYADNSCPTWSSLTGGADSSTNTIDALIPQSGSGTRNFFIADLTTVDPGFTLGTCARVVEEHDPTGIYGDPHPADAIEPFSIGKLNLINSGYFENGAGYSGPAATPEGAYTPGYLTFDADQGDIIGCTAPQTCTGSVVDAPDGNPVYESQRGLYFAIRQADLSSTTPLQVGGTQNFAVALFSSATSWIARSAQKPLITSAGFTQAWKDCGIDPTSC